MNNVTLIGNLTRDPDLKHTANHTAVVNFTVAVRRRYKDESGNQPTDFFRVTAWRRLAEICANYLCKGSKVAVSGELQMRQYVDKDGKKQTTYEIVADDVEFRPSAAQRAAGGEQAPAPPGLEERPIHYDPIDDEDMPF